MQIGERLLRIQSHLRERILSVNPSSTCPSSQDVEVDEAPVWKSNVILVSMVVPSTFRTRVMLPETMPESGDRGLIHSSGMSSKEMADPSRDVT